MIKTLIVDDDFLVRMFLKQLIDWPSQGFELIGDACSGAEALEIIEQNPPALLITDISMPGIDGIELIAEVRHRLPNSYIIALSCHGEFEYVKEAMKQGADEYVLKNLLDAPSLCRQLEIARDKLASSALEAEQTDKMRQLAEKGAKMLCADLLQSLLHSTEPIANLHERLAEADLPAFSSLLSALAVSAEAARRDTISQICRQFCRGKPAYVLPCDDSSCCILIDFSEIDFPEPWLSSFATDLSHCILEYLNVQPHLGIGQVYTGAKHLGPAVLSAYHALSYCFYGESIQYASKLSAHDSPMPDTANNLLQHLPAMLSEGLFPSILQNIQVILDECCVCLTSPNEVKHWVFDVMQTLRIDADVPSTCNDCFLLLESALQNLMQEHGCGSGNYAIEQAASFLREHFAEPISLASVAAEVHLNPAYLSFLFKRETGINFSDYLLECRMKHMKTLLRESNAPLKECAAKSGFSDYRNFCKLFKKLTGLRPAQYRSINRTI